mmetsp:Transcript_10304/g.12502  ORF Transcript_10304/g.12502 Transcript_10304/m.12502 type:complete len:281 (+) Transcript_10304:34-876(+)
MSLKSAADLLSNFFETHKISFGCKKIDAAFNGGFSVHGIHEVCGEAGCGKTQFCLQMCLEACQDDLGGKACYLTCGEGPFPVKRLEQMARENSKDPQITTLLQRVLIRECQNVDSLFDVIETQLHSLLTKQNVRLVIIDSVAGAFRTDDKFSETSSSGRSHWARSRDLFLFAAELRRLSFAHHVPFIVVNQATSSGFDKTMDHVLEPFGIEESNIRPALGLSWTSCINSRIIVTRKRALEDNNEGSEWKRHVVLVKSASSPLNKIDFTISDIGVRGITRI